MMQYVADGVVFGAVVALGTIGLGILFDLLQFPNFAHGDFLSIGAYVTLLVMGLLAGLGLGTDTVGPMSFGWGLLPGLVAAALVGSLVALLIDRLLYQPIRRRGGDRKTLIIAAFAVAMVLRNALVLGFGPDEQSFSEAIPRAIQVLPGIRLTPDDLLVLAVSLLVVVALQLFLGRTRSGKELRATAENADLARVAGIDTARVMRLAWMIAASLAALAGVGYGLTVQIRPEMGFDLLLPMFTALVLGGIGSPLGTVLAAMLVGVVESLSVLWLVPEYKQAVSFAVVFAVLMLRPQGLFGRRT